MAGIDVKETVGSLRFLWGIRYFRKKCGELVSSNVHWFAEVQKKLLMDSKKNLAWTSEVFSSPHLILLNLKNVPQKIQFYQELHL